MEKHKEHNKQKLLSKSFYSKLYIIMGAALILLVAYNMIQVKSLSPLVAEGIERGREEAIPAKIELTIISTPYCGGCSSINSTVSAILSSGVNITSKKEVEFSSEEGQQLISEYSIERAPTVIVSGETGKSASLLNLLEGIGEEKDGDYVVTQVLPPFIDTATGKIKGVISLTILNKGSCMECSNFTALIEQLDASGLEFGSRQEIDIDFKEGKEIVNKYAIKKVPALIMDSEIEAYPELVAGLEQFGSMENDGSFVIRVVNTPYYSVEEKKVKGLVTMTVLEDNTCSECYEPDDFHKVILLSMGVAFKDEKKVDISSSLGKSLINKYSIEKVPTIILEGEVEEYPGLVKSWEDVGTVEDDGAYVFRKVEVAQGSYRDLSSGEIVTPSAS